MTNAKSLALVVVSLGGTVTGRTNAGLLADIVRALGGTPTGNTNADLIGQIAAALGGEASEGTNADRLKAVADALDVDASGTNAEVLAAILTGLGGESGAGDTNATLIMGISENPPGPGPTPTPKYTVRFHVATDSVGYGSVSPASASDVAEGTAISATGQSVLIGGVSKCTATPEEDTQEYDYAFVKWTGADDGSTAVPETVTGDLDLYAHFSRTPVTPPVETFTAYFHVATDSTGYGSVSVASVADVPAGTSVTVAQTVAVGAVGSCTATPEEDTAEYDYAFVSWTGADDASTPAPTSVTGDVHYYAHFSRTPVTPEPMDPSLFTFTVADGKATVTGWAGTPPSDGYDLYFPDTDGNGHPLTEIGGSSDSSYVSVFAGAKTLRADAVETVEDRAFRQATLESVSLPSATSIADAAFIGCASLASVSLPSATSIGANAFSGCVAMTSMSFGPLTTVGTNAFYGLTFYDSDGTTVLDKTVAANLASSTFEGTASALVKTAGPMSPSLFTFTVADGNATVTGWKSGAKPSAGYDLYFPDTDGQGHPLTEIGGSSDSGYVSPWAGAATVRADSVVKVGGRAFQNASLTSVSLPSATTIGGYAFKDCTSLASISIPSATTNASGAFSGCTATEYVTFGPLSGSFSSSAYSSWTFYDTDGTTVLSKTAANLASSTFVGTADKLVKQ